MDKQIELAKSWFELAKILATIAGFLVVAAGIFWSYTSNILSTAINTIGETKWNSTYYVDVSDPLSEMLGTIPTAFGLGVWFLRTPIILVFLAIGFWIKGYICLRKLKD